MHVKLYPERASWRASRGRAGSTYDIVISVPAAIGESARRWTEKVARSKWYIAFGEQLDDV